MVDGTNAALLVAAEDGAGGTFQCGLVNFNIVGVIVVIIIWGTVRVISLKFNTVVVIGNLRWEVGQDISFIRQNGRGLGERSQRGGKNKKDDKFHDDCLLLLLMCV